MSSPAQQPPRVPLRTAHSLQAVYELGLSLHSLGDFSHKRSISLLSPESAGEYRFAGDTRIFARDNEEAATERSYTVETPLPLARTDDELCISANAQNERVRVGWAALRSFRPTADSPQLSVRHRLRISLHCAWDAPSGPLEERLEFSVPLSFVRVARVAPVAPSVPPTVLVAAPQWPAPSAPYAPGALPAYSQLFYANGERKLEYGLPAYEPVASEPLPPNFSLPLIATQA
jgi:hypothetical protein